MSGTAIGESGTTAPSGRSAWRRWANAAFDAIETRWEAPTTRRWISRALVVSFLLSIVFIELSRQGRVTELFGFPLPRNHLHAISWVVTLLLIVEIFDLILAIAGSVSRALGKQLEIFSLVLLRKTFDQLPRFEEPLVVEGHTQALLYMSAEAASALLIFGVLIVYYRIQKRQPLSDVDSDLSDFIAVKKLISLLLMVAFVVLGVVSGVVSLTLTDAEATLSLRFFELFYTVLVFADVLIVLISLSGTLGYSLVFRNFAFAIVTVFLRLALAAEPYLNALLGLGAATFGLAVSYAYGLTGKTTPDSDASRAPKAVLEARATGAPDFHRR